ncbi:MAG: MMPL family transporter [Halobacteriaceae archaeon]
MSDLATRIADGVTGYSKAVIVVLLLASIAIGAGATQVQQSSSLDQFQSETPESRALEYIQSNFTAGEQNVTTVQVIVRDDNVLDRESLLAQLQFQQTLRTDQRVAATLVEEQPTIGIANLIATTAIRQETAQELQARGAAIQAYSDRLNHTRARLVATLDTARTLQHRYDVLNRSYAQGEINQSTYQTRAAAIEAQLTDARQAATANITAYDQLGSSAAEEYRTLFGTIRSLQRDLDALNRSYAQGEINQSTYEARAADISRQIEATYQGIAGVLAPAYQALQRRVAALEADRQTLLNKTQNGSVPPISEQIAQLQSMDAAAIDQTITRVLGDGTGSSMAFGLMPTAPTYTPGSTTAEATMIIVQQTAEQADVQGSASARLETSQLALQSIAQQRFGAEHVLVFGSGIVSDEITRSMTDSLAIVGPLALLFVLVVLIIAYRDLLDIVLGLVGITLVLVWTFGFMGWLDIAFNQIFIAVPVLLIGLSIDYAIHVFMRHREERSRGDGDGVIPSMRVALASVGIALALVTATTVIGFLSNLISSVPPIREFGIVSAFGITAAFVIFGALIPAVKVELDAALEGWGFDRQKPAFGTGGGRLGRVLSIGGVAARRAPWVVLLLTLLVSAAGTYGATQVNTTFDQTDFLAEDPPDWMDRLPEPFDPGEYTIKSSLTYANENFVREDNQAQLLIRGAITDPAVLDRLATAQDRATNSDVVVVLSNNEADIRSPLTLLDRIAARNETVRQRLAEADTDGDGVPDEDVAAVFDAVYAAAPTEAASLLQRQDGEYVAMRLVVSIRGGVAGDRVTAAMRDLAAVVEGTGVSVIATGQPIVFDIVSEQLLDTVIESLLITLVAIFLFLMVTYRLTEGSAILGIVTLLPVAFSVSWILGTMYLLDIPFNVLTGLITSLTVGLGVAYSIHVSERFSHELDRTETTWEAMQTALTGTGGALLGSAATTVGGFGTLAFAILPPLRQFGIITGLTIIYAFLASVLVLPSLLVIWLRYLGPGIEAGRPALTDAAEPVVSADRTVSRDYLQPGGRYDATVTITATGRILLQERPPGTDHQIESATPDPVDVVVSGGTVYVSWDVDAETDVTVTYSGRAPHEAVDGSTLQFAGDVRAREEAVVVGGTTEIAVVADVFERILAQGDVTQEDLQTAGDALADGRLSADQFERVYSEWLRQRTRPALDDGEDTE